MFDIRTTPWDSLGTDVSYASKIEEVMNIADLNWEVEQEPIFFDEKPTGHFFNYRSDDRSLLGIVGSKYQIVNNLEAFQFTEELAGTELQYETAGALKNGKRVWMLAKMDGIKILDDEVTPYMCFTNTHDGTGSVKVFMTPVRVICQNTLNLAIKKAERMFTVRHTINVYSRLDEARQVLKLATKYMDNFTETADSLYKVKVDDKKFTKLLEELVPIKEEMTERQKNTQDEMRSDIIKAYNMEDLNNIRGTGWGFINAISDATTHRFPARVTENYEENRFLKTLDNPDMLDKAFKLIAA